jgi:hypothetical protein
MGRGFLLGRLFALLAFLGCGWGIFHSTSRGGTACFLGGCGVVALLWIFHFLAKSRKKMPWAAFAGAGLALVALGGAAYAFKGKLEKHYGAAGLFNEDQVTGRLTYSRLAWEQFQKSPLVGTGARSFEYEERMLRSLDSENWNWYSPEDSVAVFAHDDWLQLLGDYGFLGGALALVLLVTHGAAGLGLLARSATETPEPGQGERLGYTAGALAGLSALAIHSILDFNLHISTNVVIAALLLGFLGNPGRISIEEKKDAAGLPLVPLHGMWLRPVLIATTVPVVFGIFIFGPNLQRGDAHTRLGMEAYKNADYFTANQELTKVISLDTAQHTFDPNNHHAARDLGMMNLDEAYLVQRNIDSEKVPADSVRMVLRMRDSFLRSGIAWLEKAHRIYEKYPYSATGIASSYSTMGMWTEAEMWFSTSWQNGGKSSRYTAMEYGEHYLRRALSTNVADVSTRIYYIKLALQYLKPAQNKFRAGGEERIRLEKLLANTETWLRNSEITAASGIPKTPEIIDLPPPETPAPAPPAPPAPAAINEATEPPSAPPAPASTEPEAAPPNSSPRVAPLVPPK